MGSSSLDILKDSVRRIAVREIMESLVSKASFFAYPVVGPFFSALISMIVGKVLDQAVLEATIQKINWDVSGQIDELRSVLSRLEKPGLTDLQKESLDVELMSAYSKLIRFN